MQGGSRDPATPWFDAEQRRVPESPRGRLDDDHPLRRAIGSVTYPASRDEVAVAAREHGDVTSEQARWLAASLPNGTYGSEQEVVEALGRWGAPPPGVEGPF